MKSRKPGFKGFREKQPKYNAAPLHMGKKKVSGAAAAYAVGGVNEAIRFLGSRAKFAQMAPEIQQRVKFWMRAAQHVKEVTGS